MADDSSARVSGKPIGTLLSVPVLEIDTDTLSAALAYCRAGWYVLPLRRGSKHPGSVLGDHWQHQSSRDPEQVSAWFAGTDHGIALHIGRSGAIAFDVDSPDYIPKVLADAIDACHPPYQSTRRNIDFKGHYLFRVPPGRSFGNSTGRLGMQWGEVRGRNGVLVVAPSEHEKADQGGHYVWLQTGDVPLLPDSLADELPDSAEGADAATDAEVRAFLAAHTDARMPGALFAVLRAFQRDVDSGGSRHAAAVTAACWAAREAAAGAYPAKAALGKLRQAFITAMATAREGSDRVVSARTAAAEFAGITAWAVAQAHTADLDQVRQRLKASGKDLSFDHPYSDIENDQDDFDVEDSPDPIELLRGQLLAPDEVRNRPRPQPLIKGVLNLDSETWLIGAPGSFKSFIALDWAAHVAGDQDWQERRTLHGGVFYVIAEGSAGMGQRIAAWEDVYGPMTGIWFLDEPIHIKSPRWAALIELCRELKPVLIIIDTQARVTSGMNENAPEDMGLYIEAVRRLRVATGACVLTVHHPGRQGTHGRGHSSLDGAQDTEIRVEREDKTLRATVMSDKQKDMPDDLELNLTLGLRELGTDPETGDVITSLAVLESDPWEVPPPPATPWLDYIDTHQDQILTVMEDHADQDGHTTVEIRAMIKERFGDMARASFYTAWGRLKKENKITNGSSSSRWILA